MVKFATVLWSASASVPTILYSSSHNKFDPTYFVRIEAEYKTVSAATTAASPRLTADIQFHIPPVSSIICQETRILKLGYPQSMNRRLRIPVRFPRAPLLGLLATYSLAWELTIHLHPESKLKYLDSHGGSIRSRMTSPRLVPKAGVRGITEYLERMIESKAPQLPYYCVTTPSLSPINAKIYS